MVAKLIHYNTSTNGIRPTGSNMIQGQWAQQCADGGAYIKKTDGSVFEVRQLRTFATFNGNFTLTTQHIFGYLRCAPNSMTVTIPINHMNPGEWCLIRWLPNLLQSLTVSGASGVSVNGTSGGSANFGSASTTIRIQCYGTNLYDVF